MLSIVSAVTEATKERAGVEEERMRGMTDIETQTPCVLSDFEALLSSVKDGSIPEGARLFLQHLIQSSVHFPDGLRLSTTAASPQMHSLSAAPHILSLRPNGLGRCVAVSTYEANVNEQAEAVEEEFMANIFKVARTRPNLLGVPLVFHSVVKSSGDWIRTKQERMQRITPEDFRAKIFSIYFAKMVSDKEDDHLKHVRMPMTSFVHEWGLLQHSTRAEAQLEVLDIVECARRFDSDKRVGLFARLCGLATGTSDESSLPLEALNFLLDVLYYLHETTALEVRVLV